MITLTFTVDVNESRFDNMYEEDWAIHRAIKRGAVYDFFDVKIPKCWFMESANTFEDFLSSIREYFIAVGDLRQEMPTPIPIYVEDIICVEEDTKNLLLELNNYKSENDAFLVEMTNRECWEDECKKILGVFTDIKMAKAAIKKEMRGGTFTPYLNGIEEIKFNKVLD